MAHKARKKTLKVMVTITLGFISVVLIFMTMQLVSFFGQKENMSTEFYYIDSTDSIMKPEIKQVKVENKKEKLLENVLEELKYGPKGEGFNPSIPQELEFQEVSLNDRVVTVDVSDTYENMKSGEEMVCRASIVWTLTALDFVDYVKVTVAGKELTKTNGEPIGLMNRSNVVIDAIVLPESKLFETVMLYFSNEEGTGLVGEERNIEISHNQPREKFVMEQLIAGPQTKGLMETIPPETKIRDITTTEDGICYVNLSSEFLRKHSDKTMNETLPVYSIVNSLTGLEHIDKVQILIEGEKIEESQGHLDFSKPFEAVESLQD